MHFFISGFQTHVDRTKQNGFFIFVFYHGHIIVPCFPEQATGGWVVGFFEKVREWVG